MKYLTVEHLSTRLLKRVFGKIEIDRVTGCWNWLGSLDPKYGLTWYKGRHEKVHRLLYAWLIEPLPMGHEGRKVAQLDHAVCRNTRCCNPLHMELVTQWENTKRGNGPTAKNVRKTHCPKGHKYDAVWRKGPGKKGRYCRTCDRERRRDEDPVTRQRRRENSARNHQLRMHGPKREEYMKRNREAAARYREQRKAALING